MQNDINVSNVSCLGGDGGIEIFTSGGAGFGPWQYLLTDTNGVTINQATNTDYFNTTNLDQGTYIVSIEDLSGLSPCSDLQEIIVGEPDPIIVTTVNDTTICYNGQATVAAWVSGGTGSPFTMYWEDGINNFTTNPGQYSTSAVLTSDVNYIVYAQDDLGCYSDSMYVYVNVSEQITFDMDPSQIVCVNTELYIGVDNITGGFGSGYDVIWDLGDGILIPGDSVIVQPEQPTTYCVHVADQCETPDVDSCITISPTLNVPVSFSIDSDTASCPPYLVNFTNTTNPLEVASAHWYFGDGIEAQSLTNASHIYELPGNYNVGLSIVTPDGCEFDTLAINAITMYPIPSPFFIMDPQITTLTNTDIQFTNQSNGASSYYWIFDTINNLGESYDENPLFVFPDQLPDEYFIKLFAYNDFGCENSVTQMLIVNEDLLLFIPNSFSPNGDGKNDYFFVKGIELDPSAFSLSIFDRWGNAVFQTYDINEKWNGSVNGSDYYAQPGVFVYTLSYKTKNTLERKEIKGTVTLLK
jgi:gliding motility-associated-like protein